MPFFVTYINPMGSAVRSTERESDMIDSNYDLTLRLVTDVICGDAVYEAGGKDLHLIGDAMSNTAADAAYEAERFAEMRDFGFAV